MKEKQGKGLKICTTKQMLQRLPIVSAQVTADNTSKILLNEMGQTIYFFIDQKKLLKK